MLTVFVIGIGALFFIFRYILIRQVDEVLDIERDEIEQHIARYSRLPPPVSMSELQIQYWVVARPAVADYRIVKGLGAEGKRESFRRHRFPVVFEGRQYQFVVTTSLEHTKVLLTIIACVTLAMLILMLSSIYLINRTLVRRLLRPFYSTLDAIKKYSIADKRPLQLPQTQIDEFAVLNHALSEMALRGQKDYNAVRDFTAQAAHEMQTPLAVLRAELEELMQSPNLTVETATQITGIDNSVERLTRLFQSLLLLTRIKHHNYSMNEQYAMDMLLRRKSADLSEAIQARDITLNVSLAPLQVTSNKYLAEVLVSNLLTNAVRYNFEGGIIELETKGVTLKVSNSSHLPPIDEAALYRPFFRHPDVKTEGHGLGLSIVAQICATCKFGIAYSFAEGVHTFEIRF